MSGYEVCQDLWPVLCFQGFREKARAFSESLSQTIAMAATSCGGTESDTCRDKSAALDLKFVAIAAILVASVVGVAIPLVGKHWRFLRTDSSLFIATKAFAAGVILATGFVHMLAGGSRALSDPCLPESPWSKFPFSGLFAMMAALATFLVDLVGTQYYERKQGLNKEGKEQGRIGMEDSGLESGIVAVDDKDCNSTGHGHAHGHGHGYGFGDDEEIGGKHIVVSQILELGILSHSVIIGLSLGVSDSPCTISPLIAALSFHQFFEGFALGGCISQAQFKTLPATLMAFFFSVATPAGIAAGIAVSSFYNPNSVGALVVEGTLNSLSAGILIYMALVDLIAADFLGKTMRGNLGLLVVSSFMLFLGAGLMSVIAIWA